VNILEQVLPIAHIRLTPRLTEFFFAIFLFPQSGRHTDNYAPAESERKNPNGNPNKIVRVASSAVRWWRKKHCDAAQLFGAPHDDAMGALRIAQRRLEWFPVSCRQSDAWFVRPAKLEFRRLGHSHTCSVSSRLVVSRDLQERTAPKDILEIGIFGNRDAYACAVTVVGLESGGHIPPTAIH
jgi:hypothetical protein